MSQFECKRLLEEKVA